MKLEGLDGNAFSLLAAFSRAARSQGWDGPSIKAVLDEASSGNYDHLVQILIAHVEDPAGQGEESC